MTVVCNEHLSRTAYARERMRLARLRIYRDIESREKWERAIKWAAAWGRVAHRLQPCKYGRPCRFRSEQCHCRVEVCAQQAAGPLAPLV